MMPQSIRIYFEVDSASVQEAASLISGLLKVELRLSHGSYYGGWHASYSCDDFGIDVFPNAHDTGGGLGIEYHRPEFPDYGLMLWATTTPRGFDVLEKKLRHPSVVLFLTGFEASWPRKFWGVDVKFAGDLGRKGSYDTAKQRDVPLGR